MRLSVVPLRRADLDELAQVVVDLQHLEDPGAPPVARLVARRAALRAPQLGALWRAAILPSSSVTSCGERVRLGARVAEHAHEPLRDHGEQRVGHDPRLDAEIDEARHRLHRVRRVQRREHEVPGEARLQGDLRRLARRASRRRGSRRDPAAGWRGGPAANVKPCRTLVCPCVISANSTSIGSSSVTTLSSVGVHDLEQRVERRRLARAGGPAHDDEARGRDGEPLGAREIASAPARACSIGMSWWPSRTRSTSVSPWIAGERRGAQVDERFAAELEAELAVLRQAPLGHVHAREHLHARRERRRELERELRPG